MTVHFNHISKTIEEFRNYMYFIPTISGVKKAHCI